MTSTVPAQRLVHWLPQSAESNAGPRILTGCRIVFAAFIKDPQGGVFHVRELATSRVDDATCEDCRKSEQWARVSARYSRGPWRLHANCMLSLNGDLMGFVAGGIHDALLASAAPELQEVLALLLSGKPDEATAKAADLVARNPSVRFDRSPEKA